MVRVVPRYLKLLQLWVERDLGVLDPNLAFSLVASLLTFYALLYGEQVLVQNSIPNVGPAHSLVARTLNASSMMAALPNSGIVIPRLNNLLLGLPSFKQSWNLLVLKKRAFS
jgi:hypothetical protein